MKDISSKVSVGSDPELFFRQGKRIIGSERIIPKDGLTDGWGYSSIVRDGVQLELHPKHSSLVSQPVMYVGYAIKTIDALLKKSHPDVSLCFDPVVDVTKAELMALGDESRVLGCQESQNIYGLKPISVDPMKYRKRSAGGHVHLGLPESLLEYRTRLVSILDAILGIPCVLLDRDKGQAERRKLYGRAGEYRTPDYGIEYRTLSNFWLHSPVLAEFVFLQAKVAADILFTTLSGEGNPEMELLSKVKFRSMIRAIQTNSAAAAWEVWKESVRPFLTANPTVPITPAYIARFEKLVDSIAKGGLAVIDGPDPIVNWQPVNNGTGGYYGGAWTLFLSKL